MSIVGQYKKTYMTHPAKILLIGALSVGPFLCLLTFSTIPNEQIELTVFGYAFIQLIFTGILYVLCVLFPVFRGFKAPIGAFVLFWFTFFAIHLVVQPSKPIPATWVGWINMIVTLVGSANAQYTMFVILRCKRHMEMLPDKKEIPETKAESVSTWALMFASTIPAILLLLVHVLTPEGGQPLLVTVILLINIVLYKVWFDTRLYHDLLLPVAKFLL